MKQEVERVLDDVQSALRFRWIGIGAAFIIALVGWAYVFTMPDLYEGDARVFVDTRTALTPALQGLTTNQSVEAQINFVRQSLLAGPQLERIAKETGVLPLTQTDDKFRALVLDRLSDRITLTVTTAGSQNDDRTTSGTIYSFHYTDEDRERALAVIKDLLKDFVDETLGGKRAGSEQAQAFLAAQIKDYEQRLSQAEDRLAAFKKANVGLMPSEQGDFFNRLQLEVDAAKKAETDLSIAMSRRDELAKQLHSDDTVSAAGASSQGPGGRASGGSDTLSRIQETQARLDSLLLKYTDKHPDVIATQATLAELKARRTQEIESLKRGDAGAAASSGASSNPVYQNIQLELNKQDVEVAGLRRQLAQHQSTVAELRQRLNSAPQVEAEFQQLNRDYDVNKTQYTALVESYHKASLGEQADYAGSVRFEVVQPPISPITPVSPARAKLLAMIWLAAMGVAVGLCYLLNIFKPVVSSVRSINELTAFPVLGVVGIGFPTRRARDLRRQLWRFSGATVGLLVGLMVVLLLNAQGARLTVGAIRKLVHI